MCTRESKLRMAYKKEERMRGGKEGMEGLKKTTDYIS